MTTALQLATECNSIYWKENAASYLAITLVHLNKPDQAAPILAAFPTTARAQSIGQRLVWLAKAELALATGDLDTANHILDKLSLPPNADKPQIVPYLAISRVEVLIAKGQRTEANQLLVEAITSAEQQGILPLQWRLELAYGKLLEKQKHYAPAQEAFGKVRQITEQLANTIPDSILQVSFRDKIENLLTPARPLSSLQQATKEWDGLTRREREVASLITQGKSNHEIAETLVLNQRTVETHIENILSKLDFKSRVQIAAWAIQKGLI
jgi:DNA-binding NarL/FixJ family response regulator